MNLLLDILGRAWDVLLDSSVYVLLGIVVAGLVKVFLDPAGVARHLGRGRFKSVIKAALLGVPLPLCSCGVLPAAASLKRQGANSGATTAFLISTPESGVDSLAITYALLDPVMTVARPVAAAATALAAGFAENLAAPPSTALPMAPDLSCPVDGCCRRAGLRARRAQASSHLRPKGPGRHALCLWRAVGRSGHLVPGWSAVGRGDRGGDSRGPVHLLPGQGAWEACC